MQAIVSAICARTGHELRADVSSFHFDMRQRAGNGAGPALR
jgi:hypothetical protein